ncbi:MAG: gamma-glutamyl-gamma-aminobutyrate hydrolase family protein, partial [Thermomicrobium sp.]|nr:gamma-glutamyl-gamma-aminobutyrate hydrolase family protein [Thermomicrobium sp.]
YGATTVHPETYGVSDLRDHFEMTLIRLALAADLPMLAICRGLQILNVALGGTLLQHIPDQLPHALNHRQQELGIPATDPAHDVSIRPETLLATILGSGRIRVNSYHHQAIADLATPLQLAATAPDGVIEAVELPHATFVLAVQWHPERLFRHHPLQAALFSALVDAARLKMRRRAARIP